MTLLDIEFKVEHGEEEWCWSYDDMGQWSPCSIPVPCLVLTKQQWGMQQWLQGWQKCLGLLTSWCWQWCQVKGKKSLEQTLEWMSTISAGSSQGSDSQALRWAKSSRCLRTRGTCWPETAMFPTRPSSNTATSGKPSVTTTGLQVLAWALGEFRAQAQLQMLTWCRWVGADFLNIYTTCFLDFH